MNRTDAENYDDLFITKISRKILAAIPAAGWSVVIEDDYADFKDYICTRETAILEAFTSMHVVVMTPDLDPVTVDGVLIHFLLYADPALLPANRNAYGRALHKDNCQVLQTVCEDILSAAEVSVSEPSVKIRFQKELKIRSDADSREPVKKTYEVDICYWVPSV